MHHLLRGQASNKSRDPGCDGGMIAASATRFRLCSITTIVTIRPEYGHNGNSLEIKVQWNLIEDRRDRHDRRRIHSAGVISHAAFVD